MNSISKTSFSEKIKAKKMEKDLISAQKEKKLLTTFSDENILSLNHWGRFYKLYLNQHNIGRFDCSNSIPVSKLPLVADSIGSVEISIPA